MPTTVVFEQAFVLYGLVGISMLSIYLLLECRRQLAYIKTLVTKLASAEDTLEQIMLARFNGLIKPTEVLLDKYQHAAVQAEIDCIEHNREPQVG